VKSAVGIAFEFDHTTTHSSLFLHRLRAFGGYCWNVPLFFLDAFVASLVESLWWEALQQHERESTNAAGVEDDNSHHHFEKANDLAFHHYRG
jgi:hypothetical protein